MSETAIHLYDEDVIAEFSGIVGNARCVLARMFRWLVLTIRSILGIDDMSELREIFRNAIDLNRYSNSVSKRIDPCIQRSVLDAVDQLRGIDELASPVKAARLRAILAQLNDSLHLGWRQHRHDDRGAAGLGCAAVSFAAEQLQKALPAGAAATVGTVEISPAFRTSDRHVSADSGWCCQSERQL